MSEDIQQAAPQDPMQVVWDVIEPKLMVDRAKTIKELVHSWVREEFTTYGKIHSTDDISCAIELTHCRAKFDMPEIGELDLLGYRLLLQFTGMEPQHPEVTVDCFFVENQETMLIDDIILSKPEHNASQMLN